MAAAGRSAPGGRPVGVMVYDLQTDFTTVMMMSLLRRDRPGYSFSRFLGLTPVTQVLLGRGFSAARAYARMLNKAPPGLTATESK